MVVMVVEVVGAATAAGNLLVLGTFFFFFPFPFFSSA